MGDSCYSFVLASLHDSDVNWIIECFFLKYDEMKTVHERNQNSQSKPPIFLRGWIELKILDSPGQLFIFVRDWIGLKISECPKKTANLSQGLNGIEPKKFKCYTHCSVHSVLCCPLGIKTEHLDYTSQWANGLSQYQKVIKQERY